MSIDTYKRKFELLKVATHNGHRSPHKICMILAVLDLARSGRLTLNQIQFDPELLTRYMQFFSAVSTSRDNPNAHYPFFYLQGVLKGGEDSFWHLSPILGREIVLGAMSNVRKVSDVTQNIAFAYLDSELFELLQQPPAIEALSSSLALHWFDRGLEELHTVVSQYAAVARYEKKIRSTNLTALEATTPEYVRKPAFRRTVVQIYDYRCAATGIRLLLPTGESMVEAAHIHPFSEAGDDDARNGLALSPNIHWAMDKNLIAPGPDLKWHVSSLIDSRIPDNTLLTSLDNKSLILPAESRWSPKKESLEWRIARLR
jgi:putative restriction endonuclease